MHFKSKYTIDVRPDGSGSIDIAVAWAGGKKLDFKQKYNQGLNKKEFQCDMSTIIYYFNSLTNNVHAQTRAF